MKTSSFKQKPCKNCNSPFHQAWYHKTRKPMNKVGPVAKKTAAAVAKWKKTQKPTHEGYYHCYICGRPIDYLMAEHADSKARHPERRTDPTNFEPVCSPCNAKKGSKNFTDIGGRFENDT